jgi:hypothetical protein
VLARVVQAVVAAVEEKHVRNRRREDDARIKESDDHFHERAA